MRGPETCIYTYPVPRSIDLSGRKSCHCLAARRRARAITRVFDEHLRPHGLRSTQFSVLAALALKGPSPLGSLADLLGVDRTTLSRSSRLLARERWVGEEDSGGDARARVLALTPAGRRKLEAAHPAWAKAQARVGAEFARFD